MVLFFFVLYIVILVVVTKFKIAKNQLSQALILCRYLTNHYLKVAFKICDINLSIEALTQLPIMSDQL